MDKKSPDAFRTISEVADWLGVPTHVLRFWESRFTQVKPVKRAGGRRYYRPADMELLGGIRKLLHEDGMTIRGVQKLLREQGVKHVAAMSPPLDSAEMHASDGSNVVSLTSTRSSTEASEKPAPQKTEAENVDIAEARSESVDTVDDTPPPEPEHEAAEQDSPPTLTDAVDEAADELAASHVDQPAPEVMDNPAERDLFSAEVAQAAPDAVEDPALEPTAPEHDHEPTELEADVAEASGAAEVEAPLQEAVIPEESATPEVPATSEPEVITAPSAEPDTVEESDPTYLAPPPRPIDISHIAADVADDAFTSSTKSSASAQLRAFRSTGGALPDDTLRSLTARLSDLADRMPPAPSDNEQAE